MIMWILRRQRARHRMTMQVLVRPLDMADNRSLDVPPGIGIPADSDLRIAHRR